MAKYYLLLCAVGKAWNCSPAASGELSWKAWYVAKDTKCICFWNWKCSRNRPINWNFPVRSIVFGLSHFLIDRGEKNCRVLERYLGYQLLAYAKDFDATTVLAKASQRNIDTLSATNFEYVVKYYAQQGDHDSLRVILGFVCFILFPPRWLGYLP